LSRLVLRESTSLLEANVREHAAILDAIERNDAASARSLMQEHVRRAGALVTLRFEERMQAPA
jgi:DNA-binding GntR family transcriptional regulator